MSLDKKPYVGWSHGVGRCRRILHKASIVPCSRGEGFLGIEAKALDASGYLDCSRANLQSILGNVVGKPSEGRVRFDTCGVSSPRPDKAGNKVFAMWLHACILAETVDAFRRFWEHSISKSKLLEKIVDIWSCVGFTELENHEVEEKAKEEKYLNDAWVAAVGQGGAFLGAVFGLLAGSTFGAACGLIVAVFTFGLSIPFCAVLGGCGGFLFGRAYARIVGEDWARRRLNCECSMR
eukprot:TRINITY_DN21610_c0_g1_i1.p1 TRINITY_DN21610_c0_g1~~TRINITY_DN21610_c0_g1_i1.p1  ORF type:complete len:236 (-),score=34.60 TRINITY_DN21610_c0_g1_i1:144-851(-)